MANKKKKKARAEQKQHVSDVAVQFMADEALLRSPVEAAEHVPDRLAWRAPVVRDPEVADTIRAMSVSSVGALIKSIPDTQLIQQSVVARLVLTGKHDAGILADALTRAAAHERAAVWAIVRDFLAHLKVDEEITRVIHKRIVAHRGKTEENPV